MPSRDNAVRVHIERVLRVLTLIALALAAWNAARPEPEPRAEESNHAGLDNALSRWTMAPPGRIHLTLDRVPPAATRDWIRALRRAGTPVSWEAEDIPPLAIEAAPVADPRGGAMIWLVGAPNERVMLADAISPIDTVVTQRGGAMLRASIGVGPFEARLGHHVALTRLRDSLLPRRVLVLGPAGWEAKFVIAALEEAGWGIDARLALAPGIEVIQGASSAPDTARHAAVIALGPPSPTLGTAIARYVRAGGGLVLAGQSAVAAPFAPLAAGRATVRVRPATMSFAEDAPRRALAFRGIALRSDALVLEQQGDRVVVAARREGSGRVIQIGYEDTWRWRMTGGARAVEAHGDWWNGLVSAAAHRATRPVNGVAPNDAAPRAALVAALGPAVREGDRPSGDAPWVPPPVIFFSLVLTLLLAEIASRRLRGAP
jgi:hypothetical protein